MIPRFKNSAALILLCALCFLANTSAFSQAGADSLLAFIKNHPEQSSLCLSRNDTLVASLHSGRIMPLASTVKILIAIEFAKQASHHLIFENEKVPLSDPAKYYLPYTDGNAHLQWISFLKRTGRIQDDSVRLIDIARGMILFSSNADAEYLLDLLGLQEVNSNIHLLGLNQQTPLYYFSSALLLYQNPRKLKEERILHAISKMSDADYRNAANLIHMELKNDTNYKKHFRLADLSLKMQKLWSDRLPASTTLEYTRLCTILNERKYFSRETYRILAQELEGIMENPANQSWLEHAGMKGGSTAFVLTKALYATLKDGTRLAMAYFFNNLTLAENLRLQGWMNDFELEVLRNPAFQSRLSLFSESKTQAQAASYSGPRT